MTKYEMYVLINRMLEEFVRRIRRKRSGKGV